MADLPTIKATLTELISDRRIGPFAIDGDAAGLSQIFDPAVTWESLEDEDGRDVRGIYMFGDIWFLCGVVEDGTMRIGRIKYEPRGDIEWTDSRYAAAAKVFDFDAEGLARRQPMQDALRVLTRFGIGADREIVDAQVYAVGPYAMVAFSRPVFLEKDAKTGQTRWRDSEVFYFYSIEVGENAASVLASASGNLPLIKFE